MRKYVVCIIIGAALAISGQAMAGSISNIGKTVDAEYTVVVDGKALDVKAIGINGVSTTPNRALGNAVGYDVEFKNETIYFTKQEYPAESATKEGSATNVQPHVETGTEEESRLYILRSDKVQVEKKIDKLTKSIENIKNVLIPNAQSNYDNEVNQVKKEKLQIEIKSWNDMLVEQESDFLYQQKKIIEINKEIAELEAQN